MALEARSKARTPDSLRFDAMRLPSSGGREVVIKNRLVTGGRPSGKSSDDPLVSTGFPLGRGWLWNYGLEKHQTALATVGAANIGVGRRRMTLHG